MKKSLLLINGEAPKALPPLENYDLVGCTDGAFQTLLDLGVTAEEVDFISGDFDSLPVSAASAFYSKLIPTPNQEFPDFHKALELLVEKGMSHVDVYGGSGGEMDHFLGNLTAALQFNNTLTITFFDRYAKYYFLAKKELIGGVKGRMISLYPFPSAEGIQTSGLQWELNNETLDLVRRIGTRNVALLDEVEIQFTHGELLVFIAHA